MPAQNEVAELTALEANYFKYKYPSLVAYKTLYKVNINGNWHKGFISKAQIKQAMCRQVARTTVYY
jgi:hypothetical protein